MTMPSHEDPTTPLSHHGRPRGTTTLRLVPTKTHDGGSSRKTEGVDADAGSLLHLLAPDGVKLRPKEPESPKSDEIAAGGRGRRTRRSTELHPTALFDDLDDLFGAGRGAPEDDGTQRDGGVAVAPARAASRKRRAPATAEEDVVRE